MSDEIDRAQALEQHQREEALARFRAAHIVGDGEQIVHPRDCIQCGDPIPLARRLAHQSAKRCTPCEALYEAHK